MLLLKLKTNHQIFFENKSVSIVSNCKIDDNIKIKEEDTFHQNDIISKCVAKVVNQIIKSNTDVKKIKTLRGLCKNNLNNMKNSKEAPSEWKDI